MGLDDDFWEEINRLVNMPDEQLEPRGIVSALPEPVPTWLRRARSAHFLVRCQWCNRRMMELLVPHHAISVCSYCDGPSVCHCPKHGGTSPVA